MFVLKLAKSEKLWHKFLELSDSLTGVSSKYNLIDLLNPFVSATMTFLGRPVIIDAVYLFC
jgi:hypothetical protein